MNNRSVTGLQAIYYSLVTQTTVGFGDILPTNDKLYALAIVHIIISLLFVYVFFAFVISRIGKQTFMANTDITRDKEFDRRKKSSCA